MKTLSNCRIRSCCFWITVFSVCILSISVANIILATTLGNISSPGMQAGAQAVHWETDLNKAIGRAEREQRPLFVHFFGNDSSAARQMETAVFAHPNIAAQLNANFVMLRVNAPENPALAQRFSITSIPTDLIISPAGQVIHNRIGAIEPERFINYLAFLQKTIQSANIQPPRASNPSMQSAVVQPHSVPHREQPGMLHGAPLQQQAANQQPALHNPTSHINKDPFAMQSQQLPDHPSLSSPTQSMGQTAMHTNMVQNTHTHMAQSNLGQSNMGQTSMMGSNTAVVSHGGPIDVVQSHHTHTTNPPQHSGVLADSIVHAPPPVKSMVEVPLALEGFCSVTLCTEERWVTGNPAYCTMYQGYLFRFASMDALAIFARNPANYVPVAMGEDIVMMVERNKRVSGDRQFGACFQGRIFLFSNQETLNTFAEKPDYYMEIGLRYETARKEQPSHIVY